MCKNIGIKNIGKFLKPGGHGRGYLRALLFSNMEIHEIDELLLMHTGYTTQSLARETLQLTAYKEAVERNKPCWACQEYGKCSFNSMYFERCYEEDKRLWKLSWRFSRPEAYATELILGKAGKGRGVRTGTERTCP